VTPNHPVDAADAAEGCLRLVGNFREMGYDDEPSAPSLLDGKGKRDARNKAAVVAYLRRAKSISLSPGREEDFFDPSQTIGSHTMRTDGVYVWPDFLAGYVDRYDVLLPADFEEHMAQRSWILPDILDMDSLRPPWTVASAKPAGQ
jgi:hypothetical protein